MPAYRIALRIDARIHYWRQVAVGISEWLQDERPGWELHCHSPAGDLSTRERIAAWKGDGVIIGVGLDAAWEFSAWAAKGLPLIDVSAHSFPEPATLRVDSDQALIGALAARQLLACGCRSFLFAGLHPNRGWAFSQGREAGFRAEVDERHGASPVACDGFDDGQLDRNLRSLPRPLGVFACSDAIAVRAMQRCAESRIAVPHEVAVVGVDDDPTLCALSCPPIASVAPDARRIGMVAAAWMARLLAGEQASQQPILVPPMRLVVRGSAPGGQLDPLVAKALEFIAANCRQPLQGWQVAKALGVNLRTLQRHLADECGRGLLACIQEARLDALERLLRESDAGLEELAGRAGFSSYRQMAIRFHARHHLSAGAWRRRQRG